MKNNRSIKSNDEFINKISKIKLQRQYKLASFDLVNMYTNIPINKTITILEKLLHENKTLKPIAIRELIQLLKIILNQNYFSFNNQYFIQKQRFNNGITFIWFTC